MFIYYILVNADEPSNAARGHRELLRQHRNEKKRQYAEAAEDLRATYTPYVVTCDGVHDEEAEVYIKELAEKLSQKWKKSLSVVIGWLRARIQFCILRGVSACLRGCRGSWRFRGRDGEDSGALAGAVDGAAVSAVMS